MSRCQQLPRDTQAERKPLTPPSPPRCGCLYLPETRLLFQSRLSLVPIGPEALGSVSSSWGWALWHAESPAVPLGELTLHGTLLWAGSQCYLVCVPVWGPDHHPSASLGEYSQEALSTSL